MRLLTLANECRRWGLDVAEEEGWQTRGASFAALPRVVVAHHTGTRRRDGDYPSLNVVRDGRSDLPGPLSQMGLGYSGTVYVIAAGKANHAGKGSWQGISSSSLTIGCEMESPGDGSWTPAQRLAMPLLYAAMLSVLNQQAPMLCAHREWALPEGRKPDPTGVEMPQLRSDVARLLKHGPNPPPAPAPVLVEETMLLIKTSTNEKVWLTNGLTRRWVQNAKELQTLQQAGVAPAKITVVPDAVLASIKEV